MSKIRIECAPENVGLVEMALCRVGVDRMGYFPCHETGRKILRFDGLKSEMAAAFGAGAITVGEENVMPIIRIDCKHDDENAVKMSIEMARGQIIERLVADHLVGFLVASWRPAIFWSVTNEVGATNITDLGLCLSVRTLFGPLPKKALLATGL